MNEFTERWGMTEVKHTPWYEKKEQPKKTEVEQEVEPTQTSSEDSSDSDILFFDLIGF